MPVILSELQVWVGPIPSLSASALPDDPPEIQAILNLE